jgi:DNA polymerase-3 subunit alpha
METPPDYVKAAAVERQTALDRRKGGAGFLSVRPSVQCLCRRSASFCARPAATLEPSREPRLMAGVISGFRTQMTQRGRLVIVTLDDGSATVDVTVYNEVFDSQPQSVQGRRIPGRAGKVSEDRFSGGLRITAEKVMDIATARIQYAKCVRLSLQATADVSALMATLQTAIRADGSPVVIQYQNPHGHSELYLSEQWRINPDDNIKQKLIDLYSEQNVQIAYE